MKIVTLGPPGTFSHEAALTHFPEADIELAPNFDDIFQVALKQRKLGFVPFENSLHGSVDEVLDLLVETDLHVWRQYDVRIRHAFGAQEPKKVTTVASHPQALAQCRHYLKKHYPHAERFPVSSTVFAVDLAAADPTVGAIASRKAMEEGGLPIIDEDIEENGNVTRFAVIAETDPFPDLKRSQMGIVFHPTGDRAGLLHDILTPFKIYDVNLTRIENRPTGKRLGDYHFFLHFEGTRESARVQKALEELERMEGVEIVKRLGEW